MCGCEALAIAHSRVPNLCPVPTSEAGALELISFFLKNMANPKTTLYVENVTEGVLYAAFIPFGDVKDVSMPLDQATQKHRGFGFVTYLEKEDAAAAMDNVHNAELYGRVLTVNYAQPIKIKGGEQGWASQPDKCKRGRTQVDSRLWVDKYNPATEKDLAVHSKKVAEVKEWIEEQVVDPCKAQSRVLVLTGPPGVGKTAVVHTLANARGLELLEWTTPAPTLWHEYSHHAATGALYTSKIDDFEAFIEKARKFASLPTAAVDNSPRQQLRPTRFAGVNPLKMTKLLLIDDLPNVHDKQHRERLCKSLHVLATSSKFPTVLIITDEVGTGEQLDERKIVTNEILQVLGRAGARKIAFNPITVNAILKVLKKVQLIEKCKAPLMCLTAIAESCSGDIRQALTSLQFLCLGYDSRSSHSSLWDPGGGDSKSSKLKSASANAQNSESHIDVSETPTLGDRDLSLSFFHALGKLLHNKRHGDMPAQSSECENLKLKEEYCRNPPKMAEPETILSQAHADAATVAAFLHENFLQFVDEEATDDVSAISAYLSDTDCLLFGEGSTRFRRAALNLNDIEPSQVANAAASSVASRGVLFSNAHPVPPRWQSLRAPFLWQVERQQIRKKIEIRSEAFSGMFHTTCVSNSVLTTELCPYRQRLPVQSTTICLAVADQKFTSGETLHPDENEMEVDAMGEDSLGVERTGYVLEPSPAEMEIEDEIEEW